MPAERRTHTSGEDRTYLGLPPVNPPKDLQPGPIELPPFSTFPPYITTPPPVTCTLPFAVGTPPSSTRTTSSLSAHLPIYPISPTSYSGTHPPVLPQVSPLSSRTRTTRRTDDASPSKGRKPYNHKSPAVGGPGGGKGRGVGKTAPQSAGPDTGDGAPSLNVIQCRWPGCSFSETRLEGFAWRSHLHGAHYGLDANAVGICMWNGCGRSVTQAESWNHTRDHDERFRFYCSMCSRKYNTYLGLLKHTESKHLPLPDEGTSGNEGQGVAAMTGD